MSTEATIPFVAKKEEESDLPDAEISGDPLAAATARAEVAQRELRLRNDLHAFQQATAETLSDARTRLADSYRAYLDATARAQLAATNQVN